MDEIEFHFDFGSPNAYLAHRVIPDIEKRTQAWLFGMEVGRQHPRPAPEA
jgi:2-hydroxychromene-2-carboxylate isomerase